jgi:hypothetical protein
VPPFIDRGDHRVIIIRAPTTRETAAKKASTTTTISIRRFTDSISSNEPVAERPRRSIRSTRGKTAAGVAVLTRRPS